MSLQTMIKALYVLLLAQMLVVLPFKSITLAQEKPSAFMSATIKFTGHWVDRQNAGNHMSVREDGGLFRITAGDDAYGYRISCLVKKMNAVCTGSGGRLEGENFLYQSSFRVNNDGSLTESWKAFNNLQIVSGKTVWKRP